MKSRRDHHTPRGTSGHKSENQEPFQTRQLGEIFSIAETSKENKNSEVCDQCNRRTRKIIGTIFCRCGEKFGGLPELQERSARMTIERVSLVVKALTHLRIVGQNRRGDRHGSSPSQLRSTMRDRYRSCVRKTVTDQENPSGPKLYDDGCADRWEKMKHTDNKCPTRSTQ